MKTLSPFERADPAFAVETAEEQLAAFEVDMHNPLRCAQSRVDAVWRVAQAEKHFAGQPVIEQLRSRLDALIAASWAVETPAKTSPLKAFNPSAA